MEDIKHTRLANGQHEVSGGRIRGARVTFIARKFGNGTLYLGDQAIGTVSMGGTVKERVRMATEALLELSTPMVESMIDGHIATQRYSIQQAQAQMDRAQAEIDTLVRLDTARKTQ